MGKNAVRFLLFSVLLFGCEASNTTSFTKLLSLQSSGVQGSSTTQSTNPIIPTQANPNQIVLPIEVFGDAGTTRTVSFNLASIPSGGLNTIYLRTHGLNYNTAGSLRVNNGPWISISNAVAKVQGTAARYGGIGGAFFTLKMNIPILAGALIAGQNTIAFRFNGTDGRSMGYRVLEFNVLNTTGAQAIDQSVFFNDDPNTWTPPLNDAADIAAGRNLWLTADLFDSPIKATTPMFAHCTDCHAASGRDLKYFNYTNYSIQQRSMYHGLTAQQGLQIASYIRSLDVANPGRPWNPPYQPGPGLDALPVSTWSAGAGIDAVLDDDSQTQAYLPGNGTNPLAMKNPATHYTTFNRMSVRTIPIDVPLLDWNHWLPALSPMDAIGSIATFEATAFYQDYLSIRSHLSTMPNTSYIAQSFANDTNSWYGHRGAAEAQIATAAGGLGTLAGFQAAYGTAVWSATKMWEIMQDFNLEGIAPALYGSRGESRTWIGTNRFIFDVSPHAVGNSAGVSFGTMQLLGDSTNNTCPQTNGTLGSCLGSTENYLARIWYEEQLMLNGGQRESLYGGFSTIDWGYMNNFVNTPFKTTGKAEPMQQIRFLLKEYDEHDENMGPVDLGAGYSLGWNYRDNNPAGVLGMSKNGGYWPVNSANTGVLQTSYQLYLEKISQMNISNYLAVLGTSYAGNNFAPSDYILGSGSFPVGGGVGDNLNRSAADTWLAQTIAMESVYHLPQALIDGMVSHGQALWPDNNWAQYKTPGVGSVAAPIDVTITAGVDHIQLGWNPVSEATSYNVKRTSSAGVPYQTVGYFVNGTTYTDYNLDPSLTYSYKISANTATDATEGPDSAVVSSKTGTGLISQWTLGSLTNGSTQTDLGAGSGNTGQVYTDLSGNTYTGLPQNLTQWLGRSATVTAWIQLPTGFHGLGNVYTMPTIAGSNNGDGNSFTYGAVNGSGLVYASFAQCGNVSSGAPVASKTSVSDGKLHFVAISRDMTSGEINIYVDGALSNSGVGTIGECRGRSYSLGRSDGGNSNVLPNGSLQDVRIYNTVLNASTLQSIYEAK